MLQPLFSLVVAGSFCWFLVSSLCIYPHSLSYFNESIGGPLNGPKHLLGSNVDWGQDLRYVFWWESSSCPERYVWPQFLAFHGRLIPNRVGVNSMGAWHPGNCLAKYPNANQDVALASVRQGVLISSLNLILETASARRRGPGDWQSNIRSVPHRITYSIMFSKHVAANK
jgi:hypothetical protein